MAVVGCSGSQSWLYLPFRGRWENSEEWGGGGTEGKASNKGHQNYLSKESLFLFFFFWREGEGNCYRHGMQCKGAVDQKNLETTGIVDRTVTYQGERTRFQHGSYQLQSVLNLY